MKHIYIISLILLVPACGDQSHISPPSDPNSVQSYESSGQILSITPNQRYARVAHHDIADYMEAMTMTLKIETPDLLEGIAEDDSIRFTLTVTDMDAYISAIEKIE